MNAHKAIYGVVVVAVGLAASAYLGYQAYSLNKDLSKLAPSVKKSEEIKAANNYYFSWELGIKFKLTEELKKQKLTGWYTQLEDKSDTVYFSTAEMVKLDKNCNAKDGSFSALSRGEGKYKEPEEGPKSTLIKQFDDFYITAAHAQAFCSEKLAVKALLEKADKDFEQAIKNVEELK